MESGEDWGEVARMGWYRRIVTPLLFRLDPEDAHRLVLGVLSRLSRCPGSERVLRRVFRVPDDERLRVEVGDLTFPNPIGLAAGVDKNAKAVAAWFGLGFGSVEVGTVTPCPQEGNPRPRLWRFPEDETLVNALGFPSDGVAAVRARLVGRWFPGPVGINLGKNAWTPLEQAVVDYCATLVALWDVADYVVVNVSSPNTPGLRKLQRGERLEQVLAAVQETNRTLAALQRARPRPLFVKVSLDLDAGALADAIEIAVAVGADGLILGNTSIDPSLRPAGAGALPGGVSGRPLRKRAVELLSNAADRAGGRLALISVGGVLETDDVIQRLRLGADLVQVYTGLVFRGPALPAVLLRGLLRYLDEQGLPSVRALRGR
ncbi:MAG: quinone-dependent dihydroorotate dehydrogenase [Thermomicrobium sp.]|uniref:quinone-dependent dihydroorotate dehydrogenase n=1 Tax=Thermomicrobium sp. TaxID=1969469 RepID=UPI001B21E397|nr:quinone-dependent dihydroorotate dehydrogenase [Thermomicrobium sp.]MBO9351298.1 quinone-dependent dihydroorotate dehydrogenase [Thermomicrobium sp.]